MPDPARSHEGRCAELIAEVRWLFRPGTFGTFIVPRGEYSEAERRTANESLERLGYRARVQVGELLRVDLVGGQP